MTAYDYPTTPAGVLALGRPVMQLHPDLHTAAAEIVHRLDGMDPDARILARRYLLHVYGLTVGITTPASTPLAQTEEWPSDRYTIAAAVGHLDALANLIGDAHPNAAVLCLAHAEQLAQVARRG